jgi:YfiH family protein
MVSKDKLEWLEFEQLEPYPHVLHGVFERHGGTSHGPYASLNVSDSAGDHPDSVKYNRDEIRKSLGLDHLIFPHATHGIGVARITKENWSKVHQADALITTEKKIGLAITHADCQAALFFDPKNQAVAILHAGWRGSVQNIYAVLIEALKQQVGSSPKDLLVCISPSLGPCHAEFKNYKEELPQEFWPYQVKPHFFDFWAITKMQLLASGIPEKNIEFADICTYCTPDDYFSFRREKQCGRNASVIALQ